MSADPFAVPRPAPPREPSSTAEIVAFRASASKAGAAHLQAAVRRLTVTDLLSLELRP